MEVAPRYNLFKLFTLLTLFILFKLLYTAKTLACMPIYIVRNAIGVALCKMSKRQMDWSG